MNIDTVIFDLDRTLFDTEVLKDMLKHVIASYGFTEPTEQQNIYEESVASNGKIVFTFEYFIEVIRRHNPSSTKLGDEAAKRIRKNIKRTGKRLLLPGAEQLLQFCKQHNLGMYLLSLGNPTWQMKKAKWSGIEEYIPQNNYILTEIMNTHEGKSEVLRKFFGKDFTGEHAVMFNDEPRQSTEMLKAFTQLKAMMRFEKRDARVSQKDFEKMKETFGNRVEWSENLEELREKFEKLVSS